MMKVRLIKFHEVTGTSTKFNTSSTGEIIVYFDTPGTGADSIYIKDFEVLIGGKWIPMIEAFKNNDLITDNYNTIFFEPKNDAERKRGYRVTEEDLKEQGITEKKLAELDATIEDTTTAPRFY